MPHDEKKPPKNVLPDLIIPGAAFAFSVYYLTTITEVPWISQASAVFVSCLLFIAIGAWVVRTIVRIRRGEEKIVIEGILTDIPTQVKRLLLLALTVAYVLLLDPLGFTLATFVFLFFGIIVLSSVFNWKKALKVSASCAVAGYVIFIFIFKTRFPQGVVEHLVDQLVRHGA